MWFRKSELRRQVDGYGRDREALLEFAGSVKRQRIEEVTIEDVKAFYAAVVAPKNSQWERNRYMLAVRKFLKHCRGENTLDWRFVTDDPLKLVESIATMEPMKKVIQKKRGPGRPRDIVNIRRAVAMRKEGIPWRRIALALNKDPSQIVVWWKERERLLS